MTKEELIQELSRKVASGEISREEINRKLGLMVASHQGESVKEEKSDFTVTKMLYVLGAGIVVVGILIFMTQIWDDLASFARILVTLGLGMLMTLLGSVLMQREGETSLGNVFHFIGGMLIPGGALIALNELSLDSDSSYAIIFTTIFVFYLLLNTVHKQAVLTFFAIANGTTAIYLTLNALIGGPVYGFFNIEVMYQYLTMAIGVSYLLLGHSFKDGWNSKLISALYFFGITGLLGAAFIRVFDSGVWELFYFVLVFGGLALSVFMKSRIILVMSTLFLIAHVSYITSEYFADSLGWPVALVVLGFMFIGLGYASITINNKYIKEVN